MFYHTRMELADPISGLPKTGPKLIQSLKSFGIETIGQLLEHYPSRYLDFSKFTLIHALEAGEVVTIRGTIINIGARFSFPSRKTIAEALISDSTGSLKVTWFNQGYIAQTLKKGDKVLLSGKVDYYKNKLQLTNPVYEKVAQEHLHTGRLVPVYKLPESVFPKTFRALINASLVATSKFAESIPVAIRSTYDILDIPTTIRELHFPSSPELLARAKTRLAFEESFIQQLAVEQHRLSLQALAAPSITTDIDYIKSRLAELPYSLTNGQKKALWQILQDLEHKHPMNLLLQGDVGSGKTIVALLAALQVIQNGYQVALLAPTEVLAKQHFESITAQLKQFDLPTLKVGLLTSNFQSIGSRASTKAGLQKQLSQGTLQLIIGTHALLEDAVAFKQLALVVIDEQHRFGVEQRRTLTNIQSPAFTKNNKSKQKWYPHLLSMSATPIPRTAALALYGDLQITTIDELPKDRLPIKTWVVPETKRAGAYEFIRKEIAAGRQAFIITPLVEESEKIQAKSVKAEFERLQRTVFPQLKLGLVHGALKGKEKDAAMLDFKNKITNILVATSVIEVGVDIPNAALILIEGAERFGLAQLHQLRGRVGRGPHQSYCLLFSEVNHSLERLELFARTTNGFSLAEYDLKTRGFGSLFGTSQSGFHFKYGQYLTMSILETAKKAAQQLTASDVKLKNYPLLQSVALPLSKELHME